MNLGRIARHLLSVPGRARRCFPPEVLAEIERAIVAVEKSHAGELCFAIENALPFAELRGGVTPRERALHVFSLLRVWDTAANNGVLVYVLLAARSIHIVADRGFAGSVSDGEWAAVCRLMEAEFRAGRFEAGSLAGIAAVSALVGRHFPPRPDDRNELPDAPVVLG